jgi:hypothetical protein
MDVSGIATQNAGMPLFRKRDPSTGTKNSKKMSHGIGELLERCASLAGGFSQSGNAN